MSRDVIFDNIFERDMDMLLMRQFSDNNFAFIDLFLKRIHCGSDYSVLKIAHSVMTSDGETDIQVILSFNGSRIALLIEDKIDAIAQPDQAKRYEIRAEKAKTNGEYDEYYIFIVAPQKYLENNKEVSNYSYRLSYEDIKTTLTNEFDLAIMNCALAESKRGYIPVEDRKVTLFWNRMFNYVEARFPGTFAFYGKKGDIHGSTASWISIKSGKGTRIVIKSDKGYVDLEIAGYSGKFQEFSKANQTLLDSKQLYLRMASKSLAIRKYINCFDFTKSFDEQIPFIEDAFIKAKELQDLIKELKI